MFKGEFRVVDTGAGLTIGRVLFDPYGFPASVDIEIFDEVVSLDQLKELVSEIQKSLHKPVVNTRGID